MLGVTGRTPFSRDLQLTEITTYVASIYVSWHTSSETLSIPKLWESYCRLMGWQGLGIPTYLVSGWELVVRETTQVIEKIAALLWWGRGA